MGLKRDHLKLGLKAVLGLVLVAYVLKSRMVDFEVLHSLLLNPWNLLLAFFFLFMAALLCTVRWQILTRPQGMELTFKKLFSLTMIGSFFNTFMPGSVGGDLIKAWYVAGTVPDRRTRAVFSVLLDRVLGLAVIIFYSALTLLFYTEWLNGNTHLQMIALSVWGFTTAALVFALLFFTPAVWKNRLFTRILETLHRNEKIGKVLDSALLYRDHLRPIILATFVSALSVLCLNLLFYFLGRSIGIPMDLPHYFFVVPLAMTASAIPLLPGGIGTGQVAFYTLFKWMQMGDPDQGSTLCTVYQVYTILFNCMGAFFYLRFKKQPRSTNSKDVGIQPSITPVL